MSLVWAKSLRGRLLTVRFAGRAVFLVLLLLLLTLCGFFVQSCMRVARQSELDEARFADVIVVFGAAEYYGKPSPVLRARLDKALELYQSELAPVIITTGGPGWDPKFTEGGVGHDYLLAQGVPDHALIAETRASDTAVTARRVAVIMRANGMKSCLAVSDPEHLYRLQQMLRAEGVEVYTVPRPMSGKGHWLRVMREAASYDVWRLGVFFSWNAH